MILISRIEEAGITALMEVGLDPGIDHMIAKDIFDDMSESGLNVISYKSYTGGLPAPEYSENPLRYKFSWSPESALMSALNPAKYIENGKVNIEICEKCDKCEIQEKLLNYHGNISCCDFF